MVTRVNGTGASMGAFMRLTRVSVDARQHAVGVRRCGLNSTCQHSHVPMLCVSSTSVLSPTGGVYGWEQ